MGTDVNFDSNGNLEYNGNEQLSGKKILKTAFKMLDYLKKIRTTKTVVLWCT